MAKATMPPILMERQVVLAQAEDGHQLPVGLGGSRSGMSIAVMGGRGRICAGFRGAKGEGKVMGCTGKGMLEKTGGDTGLKCWQGCWEERRGTMRIDEGSSHLLLPLAGVGGAGRRGMQAGGPRRNSSLRTCGSMVGSRNWS